MQNKIFSLFPGLLDYGWFLDWVLLMGRMRLFMVRLDSGFGESISFTSLSSRHDLLGAFLHLLVLSKLFNLLFSKFSWLVILVRLRLGRRAPGDNPHSPNLIVIDTEADAKLSIHHLLSRSMSSLQVSNFSVSHGEVRSEGLKSEILLIER